LFTSPHATVNPNCVTIRTRGSGTVVTDLDPQPEPFWTGPDPNHSRAASRDRWRAALRAAPALESTDLESLLGEIADAVAARWACWEQTLSSN
jgi:hypothetical protein